MRGRNRGGTTEPAADGAVAVDGTRSPAGTVPLVSAHGVKKSFGAVQALRGVDFELMPGEVHALLGQNGAGKSTLIKVLAGVNHMDDGSVEVEGRSAAFRSPAESEAAGLAFVYQDLSLVPYMTVGANLFLGHEPHNRLGIVRRRQINREAQKFLDDHKLPLNARELVGNLPFPYRQLTEIAKALIRNAKIVVLDEPTSALSGGEEKILFDAIEAVTKRGVGVIYVTHRLAEVFQISDRVTVFRDGLNVGTFATAKTDMESLVTSIIGRKGGALAQATLEGEGAGGAAEPAIHMQEARVSHPAGQAPRLELVDVHNDRLAGVTLSVAPGEIIGFAGMVGSGRTEILETIFGLRKAQSGELRLDGERVKLRDPLDAIRRGIAMVPEDRHLQGLVLDQSIERNIALPRLDRLDRLGFFRRGPAKARAQAAIKELSVKAPGPSTRAGDLSGGNQQKVVFGKWRDPAPSIMLLDEPTVGVDVGAREEIYRVVNGFAKAGSSVIVVSSELVELLLLCDRIGVVGDGRIAGFVHRNEIEGEEHLHHIVQEFVK